MKRLLALTLLVAFVTGCPVVIQTRATVTAPTTTTQQAVPWFASLSKSAKGFVAPIPGGNIYYMAQAPLGSVNGNGTLQAPFLNANQAWGNSLYAGVMRKGKPDVLVLLPSSQPYNSTNINSGLQAGSGDPANPWFITGVDPHATTAPTTLPVIANCGININKGPGGLVISDVDFENYQHQPSNPQFNPAQGYGTTGINLMAAGCNNVLIQNCRFVGCDNAISAQNLDPATGWTTFGGPIYGLVIYRCAGLHGLSLDATHTQFIYLAGCYAPLIQECVGDHNGWAAATQPSGNPVGFTPDIFKHGIYLQATGDNSPVMSVGQSPWDNADIATAIGNSFFNNLDCTELRSGANESGDLYVDNACASHFGQRASSFSNSVVSGSNSIPGNPLGMGVEEWDAPTFTANGNVFCHKPDAYNTQAAMLCDPWATNNWANTTRTPVTSFTGNVVDGWSGYVFSSDGNAPNASSIPNITVTSNRFDQGASALCNLGGSFDPTDSFAGNQYGASSLKPFVVNSAILYSPEPWVTWQGQTHDTSTLTATVLPPDPRRADPVLAYAQSLGFASVAQFEAAVDYNIGAPQTGYNAAYTAMAADTYIESIYAPVQPPVTQPTTRSIIETDVKFSDGTTTVVKP